MSYLHLFNESSEVVSCLACVLHCREIIHISSSAVPVDYYDVNIIPGQQQLCCVMYPNWRRSRGPIPMNDEGGGSGQVKLRMGRQVGVGHQCTTGGIIPGVQQQPDCEAGSNKCVTKI